MAAHAPGPADRGDAPPRRTGRGARYHHAGSGQSIAEPACCRAGANLSPELRDALAALPSNDAVLANTLRQIPTVIARAALTGPETKNPVASQTNPCRHCRSNRRCPIWNPFPQTSPISRRSRQPHPDTAISTIPATATARCAPCRWSSPSTARPAPALALELLRVATGEQQYSVSSDPAAWSACRSAIRLFPPIATAAFGCTFHRPMRRGGFRRRRFCSGERRPDALANQVAIIGATAVGISDIAADAVGGAHGRRRRSKRNWSKIFSDGSACIRPAVSALVGTAGIYRARLCCWWFYLPRLRPVYGVLIFLAAAVALMLGSFAVFQRMHLLYDPTFPIAGNFLVVGLLLAAGFSASDRRRRELGETLGLERREQHARGRRTARGARDSNGHACRSSCIQGMPSNLDFSRCSSRRKKSAAISTMRSCSMSTACSL